MYYYWKSVLWTLFVLFTRVTYTQNVTTTTRHLTLHPDQFVLLRGPITAKSVNHVLHQWERPAIVDTMTQTNRTLLFIESPGGSVIEGHRLIHHIRALQAQDILVQCVATQFMSMAFAIFQACDERLIMEHSIGMQHPMSFAMAWNTIHVQRSLLQLYDTIEHDIVTMERNRIGVDEKSYRLRVAHEWWLYGRQIVKERVADAVITMACSSAFTNEHICPLRHF